jgi:hypothetical protein
MYKIFRFALLIVASLFAFSANGASMAYSVNSDSASSDQDSLYVIDLATGVEKLKGKLVTGIIDENGIDTRFDTEGLAIASDGTLWGVDDQSRTLFPINKAAGFVEAFREVPLTSFPPQQQIFGGHDFGMTFSCDNTLYVASVQTRTLHNLKLDGSSEIIGTTGALGKNISAIAAYGNPTQLYGLGNGTTKDGSIDSPYLYSIDLVTGVASEIGPLGDAVSLYDQAGLAFDEDGTLWGITDRRTINESQAANMPSEILQIDVGSGKATLMWTAKEIGFESLVISGSGGCSTAVDAENETPEIPTLNSAGRLLTICILMLAGMTILRKRLS